MLAKKNRNLCSAIILLTLALFIAGCTPPGPRALLKGKKLLDRGDYVAAVAELRTATDLLPANAQAWNYYGVACQRAGQSDDAVKAYQRALALNPDFAQAKTNLAVLYQKVRFPGRPKAGTPPLPGVQPANAPPRFEVIPSKK